MKFARLLLFLPAVLAANILLPAPTVHAGCSGALPQDKGQATTKFTVAGGAYTLWARVLAPSATQDSFYLRIDETYCQIVVGDSNKLTPNEFTWVSYQNGDTSKLITVSLTQGAHTLTLAGREPDVGIDKLLFLANNCVPTGTGSNCQQAAEVTPTPDPQAVPKITHSSSLRPVTLPPWALWLIIGSIIGGLLLIATAALLIINRRWPKWWRRFWPKNKRGAS